MSWAAVIAVTVGLVVVLVVVGGSVVARSASPAPACRGVDAARPLSGPRSYPHARAGIDGVRAPVKALPGTTSGADYRR
jgi:hypothetical protein